MHTCISMIQPYRFTSCLPALFKCTLSITATCKFMKTPRYISATSSQPISLTRHHHFRYTNHFHDTSPPSLSLPSQYVAVQTENESGRGLLCIQEELERVKSQVKRLKLSLWAEDTGKSACRVPADQMNRFLWENSKFCYSSLLWYGPHYCLIMTYYKN